MKTTIDFHQFRDAFERYGRIDHFSPEGLEALFNSLEQHEKDTGEELELDVIGFCGEFCEDSAESIASDFRIDCEYEYERIDAVRKLLNKNTEIIAELPDGVFIYRAF